MVTGCSYRVLCCGVMTGYDGQVAPCGHVLDATALPPGQGLSAARIALLLKLPVRVCRCGWGLQNAMIGVTLAAVNCGAQGGGGGELNGWEVGMQRREKGEEGNPPSSTSGFFFAKEPSAAM